MNAHNESRQGVLAAVRANIIAVKYILAATKAKFTAARILRIKGQLSNLSLLTAMSDPFCCSETSYPNVTS